MPFKIKEISVVFMHPNHSLIHVIHETGQKNYTSFPSKLVSKSQFCQKNHQRITLTIGCFTRTSPFLLAIASALFLKEGTMPFWILDP
jgi:hypothetical protein